MFLCVGTTMLSRKEAILKIFNTHGPDAVYIAPTGFLSRAVYNEYPNNKNIFFMQGSMGMAPAIGLGIALFTERQVVVLNGDAAHLMHLGITHTIRDEKLSNLFVYIIDNGVHESVGAQKCPPLENTYVGITEIIRVSCDGKTPRVPLGFEENTRQIIDFIKGEEDNAIGLL